MENVFFLGVGLELFYLVFKDGLDVFILCFRRFWCGSIVVFFIGGIVIFLLVFFFRF